MSKLTVDFSQAQRASFMPMHLPEGDYPATIEKCEMAKSKSDNTDMVVYTIKVKQGLYPYYCKLVPTQLWKLRELLEAAGMKVPSKAVQVDPARVVGKKITVTLGDDEYNGKMKSVIVSAQAFTQSMLDDEDDDTDDVDEFDEPEDEEPEPPAKKPAARTRKPAAKKAPEPEDDDDADFLDFDDLDD